MTSPLAQFQNIVITFPVGTGVYSTDPVTGNPQEMIINVILKAYMKQDNETTEQMQRNAAQADYSKLFLIGYLIEPKNLPNSIKFNNVGTAIVDGKEGKFIIYPTIQSAIATVRQVLGDKIRGEFQAF